MAGPGRSATTTAAPTLTKRYADVGLALLVVLVVGMMIVPLPTPLLDVLITSNITLGVLMLLVALYVPDAVAFASFPTVLLVTTLYRLALNVSSTRLILLQADAGDVIRAFGGFVVRGNYFVGAIVFLVLTLIQFLVIAKGSERVAEVGARFTLDAMPGKQMSIDADLRQGAISQDDARRKRRLLARESQFYGAMDGAMKFVKGDAIAGIVITAVNVAGGLVVGVMQRGMSAGAALQTYGLLTIGDGLVSQIPALLISTAAGLVVTRVASEDEGGGSLGADVAGQLFGSPRAMTIAAGFLVVLAVIPGLPAIPFLVLAALLFVGARRVRRSQEAAAPAGEAAAVEKEAARETKARAALTPGLVPITVDLGPELAAAVLDERGGGPLLDVAVPALREQFFADLGVVLPGVRVRRIEGGAPFAYVISLLEVPVAEAEIPDGHTLALTSPDLLAASGIAATPATDPASGEPAAFVAPRDLEAVAALGVALVEPAGVIARHVGRVAARRASDFVGLQETQSLLDQLDRTQPALVRNVIPKPVPLPLLADVLRRLVDERVSIRPLREILEALALHAPTEKDPLQLTELVRAALRRQLTHAHATGGQLAAFLVDPSVEDTIREAIQRTAGGTYLALAPDVARDIVDAARAELAGASPPLVVLTQADVRRFLRRLLETDLPDVTVLSYQELAPEVMVQPIGRIRP